MARAVTDNYNKKKYSKENYYKVGYQKSHQKIQRKINCKMFKNKGGTLPRTRLEL